MGVVHLMNGHSAPGGRQPLELDHTNRHWLRNRLRSVVVHILHRLLLLGLLLSPKAGHHHHHHHHSLLAQLTYRSELNRHKRMPTNKS